MRSSPIPIRDHWMLYADGNEAKLGDIVAIDDKHRGVVVANIDDNEYSDRYREGWVYLRSGILVDTDLGGLVHYPNNEHEHIVLLERA